MMAPKQKVQATLVIYQGLPFSQQFLYQTLEGRAVDLTGKKGLLELRINTEDPDPPVYTFSTANGKMVMGVGTIDIAGMTAVETDAFSWTQAVGHLVVEEIPGRPLPLAFLLFNVLPSTSGVPL